MKLGLGLTLILPATMKLINSPVPVSFLESGVLLLKNQEKSGICESHI